MDVREKLLKQSENMEGREKEEYIEFLHRLFSSVDNFREPVDIPKKYKQLTCKNKAKADRFLDALIESQDSCQGEPCSQL